MEQLNVDDLLLLIGQKEAMIVMLSRRLTALMAENQAMKTQSEKSAIEFPNPTAE